MAYVQPNFKTKKAMKEALREGESIIVFQPGGMFSLPAGPGDTTIEGPHFPEPHRWYAQVRYDEDNRVVKVLS